MRLRILDRGHDLPTRLTFAVVRRMARAEVPEVIKVAAYRHRYFGTPFPCARAGPGWKPANGQPEPASFFGLPCRARGQAVCAAWTQRYGWSVPTPCSRMKALTSRV
jgi:hypothetical protein